jgi:hypothetical protein
VFPEEDLRAEFWFFVRQRALDPRAKLGPIKPAGTPELDWLEETRASIAYYLDESSQYVAYEQGGPATYDTLQEALVAFLIYEVSKRARDWSHQTSRSAMQPGFARWC